MAHDTEERVRKVSERPSGNYYGSGTKNGGCSDWYLVVLDGPDQQGVLASNDGGGGIGGTIR